MKITVIGGGPAGLYFAILTKRRRPSTEIAVIERDGPHDTFGWGIVFSDQTFSYLQTADDISFRRIVESCQTWDNVDVVHRDRKVTIRGNLFSGVARLRFLNILHERCRELGVDLLFHSNVSDVEARQADTDLLVGADGANSLVRQTYRDFFEPSLDPRKNKYIWLGTYRLFHGLTLTFRQNDDGVFAAHSYKFNDTTSTFIVECPEDVWVRAGLAKRSEQETCAYLERLFAQDLGGHALLTNNFVRWLSFVLVRNRAWHHKNVVLLGDALHTAHFSIGSGTKLALEDAIALDQSMARHGSDLNLALADFQLTRKPVVDRIQDAAFESLRMFENIESDMVLDPLALAYKLMTRSGRIDRDKLMKRDPKFVEEYERSRQS
jgi:anthraniloyl-CoA monooxygenase